MADKPNRDSPPPAMDAVVQSPKLTEIVAGMLRHKIVTGELAQGDFLPPEPELMVQLGVSRPTLREALRVLESESLIKPRRGSRTGAQVQAPSIDLASRYMGFVLQYEGVTLEDVQQARRTLEPPIAGMLAARRDPHAIVQLRELLEREESCLNDDFSFGHASVRFHERVVDLVGIRTLGMCVRQFNWVIERLTEIGQRERLAAGFAPATLPAHRAHVHFVKLLETASPSEVEDFWRVHCDAVGEVLLRGREGERVLDLFT